MKPEPAAPPAQDLSTLLDAVLESLVVEGRGRGGLRHYQANEDAVNALKLYHAVQKALSGKR